LLRDLQHDRPMLSCRFDPTGRFVFAGAHDNQIHRWELSNGQKTSLQGHDSWVRSLAFLPNQNTLVSGGYDGKMIWWPVDAASPTPVRTLESHDGWVRALALSPNGQILASCGNDNLVKLWNPATGALIRELAGHDSHVYNLAFHPSGQSLISADLQGHIKQWDFNQGTVTRTFDATILARYDTTFRATLGGVRSMAFNTDGSLFVCAGITDVTNAFAGVGNPVFLLFNWQSGERSLVLRPPQNVNRGRAWGVAFHPDGFVIGTGGNTAPGLWFWRPNSAQPFATVGLPSQSRDLDLHPDARRLAVACYDNKLRIYDMVPA
jgi:WD40 repeat protein